MELCKAQVQVDECVIHIAEATDEMYTDLRFCLLSSTWFPRPLGACLWSLPHIIFALCFTLLQLTIFIALFLLAVLGDAIRFFGTVVLTIVMAPLFFLFGGGVIVALGWLLLLITCRCCVMPGRAPGQSVGHYILSFGAPFTPQPEAPVEGAGLWDSVRQHFQKYFLASLYRHTKLVSVPYWRLRLGDLCQEIVPLYPAIVI